MVDTHPDTLCFPFPTNNALLINFRLISDAETLLLGTDRACKSAQSVRKTYMQRAHIPTALPLCMPPSVVGFSLFLFLFPPLPREVLALTNGPSPSSERESEKESKSWEREAYYSVLTFSLRGGWGGGGMEREKDKAHNFFLVPVLPPPPLSPLPDSRGLTQDRNYRKEAGLPGPISTPDKAKRREKAFFVCVSLTF